MNALVFKRSNEGDFDLFSTITRTEGKYNVSC